MTQLIAAISMGLIYGLLALGVLISFRVLAFRDLTVEGTVTLGGAVAGILIVSGWNPFLATFLAFLAGMLAGAVTGILTTRFQINGLLAGILVMTALYSINLRVMGRSNLPLFQQTTLLTLVKDRIPEREWDLGRWQVPVQDVCVTLACGAVIALAAAVLYGFFKTNLGLAMRATGDNEHMIRALGVEVGWMLTFGLALSNGLVALSGALLVQYQGFADAQLGVGMVVWGLASVIIGEALVGTRPLGILIVGTVMGSVLFRLLVAIALRWGLNPVDLKLVTAVFVFAALVMPGVIGSTRRRVLASLKP